MMDEDDLSDFDAATTSSRWGRGGRTPWLRSLSLYALPAGLLLGSTLAVVASIRGMSILTQRATVQEGDLSTFLAWTGLTALAAVVLGILGVRAYLTNRNGRTGRDLEEQPYYDPATGLPTNRLFQSMVEQTLSRAGRAERLVAVLLLDLEQIKVISQRKGAVSGDSALRVMAARVKGCLRGNPVVARIAGDEFAVLLEGPTSREEVSQLAEKIRQTVNLPLTLQGEEILLNASIGVAFHRTDGHSADELMARAAEAMADAKSSEEALHIEPALPALPLTRHSSAQTAPSPD